MDALRIIALHGVFRVDHSHARLDAQSKENMANISEKTSSLPWHCTTCSALRKKETAISTVSHELRTPINGVMGMARIWRNGFGSGAAQAG